MKNLWIVLFLLFVSCANAQDSIAKPEIIKNKNLSFNGQATTWTVFQFAENINSQLGVRFVPNLTGFKNFSEKSKLDFEASLNINGTLNWSGSNYDTSIYIFKPYRVWLRYSGANWELRGGLQKINFGSAKIFRPLMWFDEMDIRDPLQLTDGVYGVLGKYFFPNNTNIWIWTLMGNKNPKGFETLGSTKWIPEIGGRFETPLGRGEIGFSTHIRKADIHSKISEIPEKTYINERKFGLDGKWDIGIGLWFESSISIFDKTDYPIYIYNDMWNLGADYTIPIGSGVNISAEYFRYHIGNNLWKDGIAANIFGGMLTYPLTMIDKASVMIFYVKEVEKFFNYVSFSRTYDNWEIYLIGFWNPEINLPIGQQLNGKNLFMGKGIQVMVNYNF